MAESRATVEQVLRGPEGGSWIHADHGPLGAPLRCDLCGTFNQAAWRYIVGTNAVAHATICDECAAGLLLP